jgi:hypothetical protein
MLTVNHCSDDATLDGQLCRTNGTTELGISAGPYNPEDHFARMKPDNSTSFRHILYVVPTHPHPPPVPGYYWLSRLDDSHIDETWNPMADYRYTDWTFIELRNFPGTILLRYATGPGNGWVAVQEKSETGIVRWVPHWVDVEDAPAGSKKIDVEVVEATPGVNS